MNRNKSKKKKNEGEKKNNEPKKGTWQKQKIEHASVYNLREAAVCLVHVLNINQCSNNTLSLLAAHVNVIFSIIAQAKRYAPDMNV